MLRRMWAAVLAVLLLGGCGQGSEDFTVRIARPPERVIEVLGHGGLDGEFSEHFPGIKIVRTEPSADEVLYTIPSDSSFPTAIKLTFEAAGGGKETVVHAAIDVPAVKVSLKGKPKVISEHKVEVAIRELVEKVGKKLEHGGDTGAERKEFSQILTALAIVTDSKQFGLAQDMESHHEHYMGGFGSLYDGDDDSDAAAPANGNAPAAAADPDAAVREREYREKQRTAAAAAPMDDADGDEAGGAGTTPDESEPG